MSEGLKIEARYRSRLEQRIAAQLEQEGVRFAYEPRRIPYVVPERDAKYLLDFECPSQIILEGKGWFKTAAERQKYIFIRDSNPGIDIRFVFQNAKKPIYKGSKTTYAMWADTHGFKWCDKGRVPPEWIAEMREAQSGRRRITT